VRFRLPILCLCLTILFAVNLSAYDFGGTIDNSTSFRYAGSDSWLQEDKLALWFSSPLGDSLNFVAQGSYLYNYEAGHYHILDFDLLQLRGQFIIGKRHPSQLVFRIGRFAIADTTEMVLNDNIDGLEIGWASMIANTILSVGYTGLQWERVSTVSLSREDEKDTDNLAPPRLVGSLQAQFPELFYRQDLLVSILFQQDLRPEGSDFETSGTGGKLSSQYFGLGLEGPLFSSLYYDTFAYLGTGSTPSIIDGTPQYSPIFSLLTGFTLRYYFEEFHNSKAELHFLFSSGDKDFMELIDGFYEGNTAERANVFVPISRQQLAVAFSPRLGNLVVAEMGYSIKPIDVLQAMLKGFIFFRPTIGPISDLRIDSLSESKYLGTEIDCILNFRPFSDLGTALSLGLFLPKGGAFDSTYQKAEFQGKLEISFSF